MTCAAVGLATMAAAMASAGAARVDPDGLPVACRVIDGPDPRGWQSLAPLRSGGLPAGTRGWECVPGVVRSDGVESFRVEVDVNGTVQAVRLTAITVLIVGPGPEPVALRDDGLGPDRVAGDRVWTAGPFRYNTAVPFPSHYESDAESPAGLYTVNVGTVRVEEIGGAVTEFLLPPSVGLVRTDLPAPPVVIDGAPDFAVSAHLVNLRSDDHVTQRFMRFLGADIAALTRRMYAALPDVFDFVMVFSGEKIERVPHTDPNNYNAGLHVQARIDHTGTGRVPFDDSGYYGSSGRLLAVNVLDAYRRGIVGNNATHELVHQWSSYTHPSLGLSDGSGHYDPWTSVGSLVGGFAWIDNGDGTFTRNCEQGRNGAHRAPPLDLYMMGLVPAAAVPDLHRSQLGGPPTCDQVIGSYTTTTIADIQAVHGPRVPGPESAQREFGIAFLIETNGRLLNATERTFYDRLAEHYTSALPAQAPDPYVEFNWPTITRFFGQGILWTSDIVQLAAGVSSPPRSASAVQLASPVPNPSASSCHLAWEIPGAPGTNVSATLEVLDLQGRRVRTLVSGWTPVGRGAASWDGRDANGRAAPDGVYWARLRCDRGVATRRLVRWGALR